MLGADASLADRIFFGEEANQPQRDSHAGVVTTDLPRTRVHITSMVRDFAPSHLVCMTLSVGVLAK